jgi:hypothetical protein
MQVRGCRPHRRMTGRCVVPIQRQTAFSRTGVMSTNRSALRLLHLQMCSTTVYTKSIREFSARRATKVVWPLTSSAHSLPQIGQTMSRATAEISEWKGYITEDITEGRNCMPELWNYTAAVASSVRKFDLNDHFLRVTRKTAKYSPTACARSLRELVGNRIISKVLGLLALKGPAVSDPFALS